MWILDRYHVFRYSFIHTNNSWWKTILSKAKLISKMLFALPFLLRMLASNQTARDVVTMLSILHQLCDGLGQWHIQWFAWFAGKKGKKKKGVTVDLWSFLADGNGPTPNIPLKSSNWVDEVEDEHGKAIDLSWRIIFMRKMIKIKLFFLIIKYICSYIPDSQVCQDYKLCATYIMLAKLWQKLSMICHVS